MKRPFLVMIFFPGLLLWSTPSLIIPREKPADLNFYEKSLHYTNRGLAFWYDKANGGLERITGIPFSKLSCNGCHVRTCDSCHLKEVAGKPAYSLEAAKAETACEECHDVSKCPSNTIHKGKVDCSACHVRDVPSCYNCHFDTKVKEGKSVSLPLNNSLFLINHAGKVTLGNLHTFVYQDRTMAVFAPSFRHWIMKQGRGCRDCHATRIVRDIVNGRFRVVNWENGALKNAAGIIPVLDRLDWNFVFLNYADGKWVPIDKPPRPLLNYSGYCAPITREQLVKMATPQAANP